MKKSYWVLTILILIFFSLGAQCNRNSGPTSTAYIGGTDGLVISFVEDAPPEIISDKNSEEFNIILKLENNGEYDIKSGDIVATLSGISRDDFSMSTLSQKSNFDLTRVIKATEVQGETGGKIEGGEEYLDMGKIRYKPDLAADFQTTVRADVCYKYRSRPVSKICLKKDASQVRVDDVCQIDSENVDYENSAAPVQLTQISERRAGQNRVMVTFVLENSGEGATYAPNKFTSSCTTDISDAGELYITVYSLSSNINPKCGILGGTNKGAVKLIDGKRTINCLIETNGLQEQAYEVYLNIDIDYFYRQFITQDILIRNADYY